jgi:hypothetical protein
MNFKKWCLLEEVILRYQGDFVDFLEQDESEIGNHLISLDGDDLNVLFTNIGLNPEKNDHRLGIFLFSSL